MFVSFTALVRNLANALVTAEDLATGLYYFGCSREHAYKPWGDTGGHDVCNELAWFFKKSTAGEEEEVFDADRAAAAHGLLVAALNHAERDGRIIWREKGAPNSIEQLAALLQGNGILNEETSAKTIDAAPPHYNYPAVADLIERYSLPLNVIR